MNAVQASKQGMHKVMLTCFTSNTGAQRLYRKLGYSKDETSPDPEVDGPEFAGCVPLSTEGGISLWIWLYFCVYISRYSMLTCHVRCHRGSQTVDYSHLEQHEHKACKF